MIWNVANSRKQDGSTQMVVSQSMIVMRIYWILDAAKLFLSPQPTVHHSLTFLNTRRYLGSRGPQSRLSKTADYLATCKGLDLLGQAQLAEF